MESVSLIAAFTAGLVSFLSPCVLPLVPGYISMISGTSIDKLQVSDNEAVLRRVLFHSLLFILGFSVVFISLGASASWIGQALLSRMTILYKVAGVIIIIFGLHLTGILKIGLLYRDARFHSAGKPASATGAFLIGLAFAFGWTPCIGPILAVILGLAASQETVYQGTFLLAMYSAGLAVPFLLTSLGVNRFLKFYQRFRVHLHQVEVFSGIILIVLGAMIFSNQFTRLAGYLSFLNRFAL
jgi:cytochrome c-type biogenesis protein